MSKTDKSVATAANACGEPVLSSGATAPTVKCPHCGKAVPWTPASTHRPFCSERCRLIDLGAWASESHRIPGEALPPTDDAGHD